MSFTPLSSQRSTPDVSIYECEVNLKFRLIEEKGALSPQNIDREALLDTLLEAFGYGDDDFMEATMVQAKVNEMAETDASPEMRRRLIRLRNSRDAR
jgi:hypothetical protein